MTKGVVVTGGRAPGSRVTIEWCQDRTLVAADSGLEWVHERGLRPDAIVGDMDSLRDRSLIDRYPESEVHRYPRAKDATDTEIGLAYLRDRGIDDVTLIGGGGGRLDHLIAVLRLFERDVAPRRWLTDHEDVRLITDSLDIRTRPGEVLSFFAVGKEVTTMRSTGLRWNLDGLRWGPEDIGVSNETVGERVRVRMLSGRLLLVRALGDVVEL